MNSLKSKEHVFKTSSGKHRETDPSVLHLISPSGLCHLHLDLLSLSSIFQEGFMEQNDLSESTRCLLKNEAF